MVPLASSLELGEAATRIDFGEPDPVVLIFWL